MVDLSSVYEPVRCGELYGFSRAFVLGYASDHDNTLVALSVQASSVVTEQIHYELQGQDKELTLVATGSHNRYARSRKSHFKVLKAPIPDTHEVSLIMLNDSLFKLVRDMHYTHVWYRGEQQFMDELFLRVRQIVYVPVKKEWSEFLYREGSRTNWRQIPMCGEMTHMGPENKATQRNWLSGGFHIGYIANEREAWESLISKGLREERITV